MEAAPERRDLVRALRFTRGFVVKGCLNKPFTRALKDEGNCLLDHRESSSEVYGKQSCPRPWAFRKVFFLLKLIMQHSVLKVTTLQPYEQSDRLGLWGKAAFVVLSSLLLDIVIK